MPDTAHGPGAETHGGRPETDRLGLTDPVPRPIDAGKPLSLRRNFLWSFSGNVVHAASRWAVIILLARLGSAEILGQMMLALAICTPLSALVNLGICGVQVTDAKRQYRFGDYLGLRLVSSVLMLLVVVGILAAGAYESQLARVILVIAIGKVFESISEVFRALMQQHERMDRVGIALMIQGPLTLALLALGWHATGSVVGAAIGFSLAVAATFFAYDLPNAYCLIRATSTAVYGRVGSRAPVWALLRPRWQPQTVLRLSRLALPLGVVSTMIALVPNLPRYMVSRDLGNHALGIFASIAALAAIGTTVTIAVTQAALPRLAKYYAQGQLRAFCRLLGKLLAVVGCLGVGMVLVIVAAGRPILLLLYGAEFAEHADLAVWLTIAAAILYLRSPLGTAVQAMQRFRAHMLIRGSSILALLALLPGLINRFGINGAAAAMAISSLLSVLMYGLAVTLSIRGAAHMATGLRIEPAN